ncbi:glycoside hydrolase family 9 protein [Lacinutrix undariae]
MIKSFLYVIFLLFVNYLSYSNNLKIDNNATCLLKTTLTDPSHNIRYNQVGYFPSRNKTISINSSNTFSNLSYTITNSLNVTVLSGVTDTAIYWSSAEEYVALIDISELNTEGVYKIATNETEAFFNISNTAYDTLSEAALKYYYYARASTEITSSNGGVWNRPTGIPDTNVIIHSSAASSNRPTGTIISAPKGWYDAGDYNKYVVNSGISTYTLLTAYEHYATYYDNKDLNIPESTNNIPDILDEVIWNLDWLLNMQESTYNGGDGGVYHKLTSLNFSGIVMPNNYNLDRYVVQKTTAATLNFAAVTAVASRIFANFNTEKPGYSAQLLQASEAAYAWAKANPIIYYTQPDDVYTGTYGDTDLLDEFNWAATELFITTENATYKEDINVNTMYGGTPSWGESDGLSLISIAHHNATLASEINTTTTNNILIQTANAIKNKINTSPMQASLVTSEYYWGSNSRFGNNLMMLIRAYELTNDDSYLNATYTAIDYLLGKNGTGYCYVTGFGDQQVMYPHHTISRADNVTNPIPGMLVGGPHTSASMVGDCASYPNTAAANTYLDNTCSYSTNEVTINWNAPLAYAVNALKYYQDNLSVLSLENQESTNNKIILSPNPTSNFFKIKGLKNTVTHISIYDFLGKLTHSQSINNSNESINVSSLKNAIYFVEIETENNKYIKKLILK